MLRLRAEISRLQSSQQPSHSHIERLRNHFKRAKCHALPAGLKPIEVDTIQAGPLRELILRETSLFATLWIRSPTIRLISDCKAPSYGAMLL